MTALGVPDEYEAFIVDSLTEVTLARLPWTSIQWGRVNKSVSQASVTMDGSSDYFACCKVLSVIHAWNQLLVIERNGFRVWDGLITGWSTGNTITVTAYDRAIMLAKRLVGVDLDVPYAFGNDAFSYIIEPLLTDAGFFLPGVNQMPCGFALADPRQQPGLPTIGAYFGGSFRVATLTPIAQFFQEWSSSSDLNYTQRNDILFVSLDAAERTFNASSPDNLGMYNDTTGVIRRMVLSPSTTLADATSIAVTVDATDLYTVGYSAGTGQGVAGFANYTTDAGVYVPYAIHGVVTDSQTVNGSVVFNAYGQPSGRQDRSNSSPRVGLESVALAPTFGADILKPDLSNLLPGICITVDFPDACSLDVYHETTSAITFEQVGDSRIGLAKLEQLDVNVSVDSAGINETVAISLQAFVEFA